MKKEFTRDLETLKNALHGTVVVAGDRAYDEARQVWNAMIDRRPAVILQCADPGDVPIGIRFAREHGLEISVRGGGHNIAGYAICDGGVVIDFSRMKNVRVDPERRRALVEPGATLREFDHATQAYGLSTPMGVNSTTGVAGLTVGGGYGWLSREYGMTIDNLVSVNLVTADAQSIRASDQENQDLFWAVRGGGGNFGIVTQFEFRLHPLGPNVYAGFVVFPFGQAKQVLRHYREFIQSAPNQLNPWLMLRQAPPMPFLPAEVQGKEAVVLVVFYSGDAERGRELIRPLHSFGDVLGEHVGAVPYEEWQQTFDPFLTPGARNYWKSLNLIELGDEVVDAMVAHLERLPSPECDIFVGLVDGAANRVPRDATAYDARDARFVVNAHARWRSPAEDDRCIAWARSLFTAVAPHATAGAYVNFMTAEEADRLPAAYGANHARLLEIKRRYDPDNVFHLNQNINPGARETQRRKRRTA